MKILWESFCLLKMAAKGLIIKLKKCLVLSIYGLLNFINHIPARKLSTEASSNFNLDYTLKSSLFPVNTPDERCMTCTLSQISRSPSFH